MTPSAIAAEIVRLTGLAMRYQQRMWESQVPAAFFHESRRDAWYRQQIFDHLQRLAYWQEQARPFLERTDAP